VISSPRHARKLGATRNNSTERKRTRSACQFGKVDMPQAAFIEALKMGDG
jgi:hypothetical protein